MHAIHHRHLPMDPFRCIPLDATSFFNRRKGVATSGGTMPLSHRFEPVIYLLWIKCGIFHIEKYGRLWSLVVFVSRFFQEPTTQITKQKSETKTETNNWILDGSYCLSLTLTVFPESSANCCLTSLECNLPKQWFLSDCGSPQHQVRKQIWAWKHSPVHLPFAAMSCEVKLNTVQGGVITLDIPITATVRELKAMLLEKHPCQDPIERKILKVELLRDSSIIDDAETLDAAGLFCTESLVTVAYARNEVEAATKDDIDHIHTQRFFGVKIPCNLTEISRYAFQNCKLLVLVTISGSVTHIGCHAFAGCTSLTSISISESVTRIGACAFARCTSLNRIAMGESVTHIGPIAFSECTSLMSISIGESVTHIGVGAFAGCTSLMSISIGESVTHIGVGAFAGCTSLMSISIGESVSHIWERAFAGCTSLRSVTMGESVTHIGTGAFAVCRSLSSIMLPVSVRHISERLKAESLSRSLKIITIPATEGRKRLRIEWGSVQICHDGNRWYNHSKEKDHAFPSAPVAL